MKKLKRLSLNKSVIRSLHSKKMLGFAAAGAGFAAFGAHAQAQVIIDDNFTSGSQYGTSTIGLVPDTTNTPGGVWSLVGSGDGDSAQHKHTQNSVQLVIGGISTLDVEHNNGATAISIGSTASGNYAITGYINPNGSGNTPSTQTAYLGFYSQVGATTTGSNYNQDPTPYPAGDSPTAHLVGLGLNGDGTLNYFVNSSTPISTGINGGSGAFNGSIGTGYTTLSYNLTYNAGAGTATFSNITLGGVSYSNTYTTGVLSAGASTVAYAGIGAGNGAEVAFTNFEVSGVTATPEPSTYALLASGALALGAYQYRRRQQGGI